MIPDRRTESCAPGEGPRRLEWRVHLLRQLGEKGYYVMVFIVASGAAGYFLFGGSPMWGAVAAGISVIAFSSVLFPRRYAADEEGIEVRTWYSRTRRKWSEFRRIEPFPHGVTLLTRAKEGRFEHLRSLDVFLPEDSEEIKAFIEDKLEGSLGGREAEEG